MFLTLLLSIINFKPAAAAPGSNTDIIIIGTVHYSTNNYNSDTLLAILNKVNPDVILVECDSSYMTSKFDLKEDIQFSFLETRAITRYLKEKPAILRPYDINGRDAFLDNHERKRNEQNFFSELNYLSQNNNLSSNTLEILNRILSMMNTSERMANSAASYINSKEGSMYIDTINYYTYTGLYDLINSTSELMHFKSYWEEESNYWIRRNNVMIQNILKYKREFTGKKIVVLCGLSHKNILKNGIINEAEEEKFNVKEFWESY